MRNLQEFPITRNEVIDFLKLNVETEAIVSEAFGHEHDGEALAATALSVAKAASIIIQNGDGYAALLLHQAFNSQNIPIKEMA